MWVLRGELDPASGALLGSLLDHLAKPKPVQVEDSDGTLIEVSDARTVAQRSADALMDLIRAGAASPTHGTRGGEPPRITIIAHAGDIATARAAASGHADGSGDVAVSGAGGGGYLGTGSHIGPGLLARLSCDAVLQRALLAPSGALLNFGRDVRTITPAQRRALVARDRGCVIPGCTARAHQCEGHHVVWWRHGGDTSIANLALLCSRHHTEIHTGMWILTMRDGVPGPGPRTGSTMGAGPGATGSTTTFEPWVTSVGNCASISAMTPTAMTQPQIEPATPDTNHRLWPRSFRTT